MHSIKEARKFIQKNPDLADAQILSRLILALESEADFSISDIYLLDGQRFQLALDIMEEWRLDRFYAGKAKLFDVARQAAEIKPSQPA